MQRVLSLLLIFLLLVSQSFISVPHTHAGTSLVEPEAHAATPHVHLNNSGHSHTHHHQQSDETESTAPEAEQSPDHDSDAIYSTEIQLLRANKVSKVVPVELAVFLCVIDDGSTENSESRISTTSRIAPKQQQKCALFLLKQSIRC